MANEARVLSRLSITKSNLKYTTPSSNFSATVTGIDGPTPGAVTVSTSGTIIDLTELTTPGFCELRNIDSTNYVEYGIWDGSTFWPLGEIAAGENYVLKLSRNIGLGSGTAYGFLYMKANTASVNVVIAAFEV